MTHLYFTGFDCLGCRAAYGPDQDLLDLARFGREVHRDALARRPAGVVAGVRPGQSHRRAQGRCRRPRRWSAATTRWPAPPPATRPRPPRPGPRAQPIPLLPEPSGAVPEAAGFKDFDRILDLVDIPRNIVSGDDAGLAEAERIYEFDHRPAAINGASDLLGRLFGKAGRHARSAIGLSSLPSNVSVEVEPIVEVR